jgi:hypothetical protein
LELRPQAGNPWPLRLAVAAAVVLTGSVSLWHAERKTTKPSNPVAMQAVQSIGVPQTQMSTPALTKLALDDSEAFDALLARESRTVLPSMQDEHSALRVLSKE